MQAVPLANFRGSYASLPERFFARPGAQPVAEPRLIRLNRPLAKELNIDPDRLAGPEGLALLAGNRFPDNASPIALAYAGHQFGGFVPQLGDGRALLVGEVEDRNGVLRDIQLKGSGPTRFSRAADGRAALGPVLREYVVSEAMHALGIPTTRSLAAVMTGETVYRERPQQGAVVTRVAASHIRIGTFQFFAARQDVEGLRILADYAIGRHYPHIAGTAKPYLGLLQAVIEAQAALVARWMLVGFIHGVMNTDNMTISGETIDYGPCAFMDAYHPAQVFSSIDRQGRYAYANQPRIAVWNLARLAETLLPLIDENEDVAIRLAEEALGTFQAKYNAPFHRGWRAKLGLATEEEDDLQLAADLLDRMARNEADFTLTFRGLADEIDGRGSVRGLFANADDFDAWAEAWRERVGREPGGHEASRRLILATNPKFIVRNHRMEEAIVAAEQGDFGPFERLLAVTARPFDEQPGMEAYAQAPLPEERVLRTFCGT